MALVRAFAAESIRFTRPVTFSVGSAHAFPLARGGKPRSRISRGSALSGQGGGTVDRTILWTRGH